MSFLSKIKIYDKYIFKQVLFSSLGAILLFTIVWIAPEMLLNTIRSVLEGQMTAKTGILVLLYELPKILGKAFPVGLLLGTLFTFDKLSKDSELTILRVAGLSFQRIIAPILILSVVFTWLCFVTYDKLIPMSANKLLAIDKHVPYSQFVYTQKDENGVPLLAVVVSKFTKYEMSQIIVLDFSKRMYKDMHGMSNIFMAKTADHYDDKWVLNDVTQYQISYDGIFTDINKFDKLEILNGDSAKNAYTLMMNSLKRDRELDNGELRHYVKLLKQEGLEEEHRFMLNKYYQRFFHPFVCIILAIMGCLLGFSKPREQRLVGFTIAIGCIFLYYITLPFFDLMAEKGVMLPLFTASLPLIAFSIAVWAFYKSKDLG